MEQIKGGMPEMMKLVALSQMNAARTVKSSQGEGSEFEKLLGQKSGETKQESTSGKNDTDAKEVAEKENVKAEKPKTDEKEEAETCDVAREAACAQIVWMVPQASEEVQAAVETETVEVAEIGEMITVTGQSAETIVVSESTQMVENGELAAQETVVAEETGLAPEQTVEAPQNIAEAQTETVTEKDAEPVNTVAKATEAPVDEAEDETAGEIVVTEAPLFKDVETAPIKVAEAPAQAEAPELETQVSDKLVQILESGENRVEIQLTPEALGKMTIELTRSADGTLNVILNAENAETRNLLTRHITTLQETLVDRGQPSVQIEVSRGEETQQQNFQQQDLRDDANGSQNGQQQRHREESSGEDFLQQLRLGLIDLQEEIR